LQRPELIEFFSCFSSFKRDILRNPTNKPNNTPSDNVKCDSY